MNSKRLYTFSVVSFFVMWGILGMRTAAKPSQEPMLQAIAPAAGTTIVTSQTANLAGIPVTGDPEPLWIEIVVFYGLIGLTAMFLVLALLKLANASTISYGHPKRAPGEKTHKS